MPQIFRRFRDTQNSSSWLSRTFTTRSNTGNVEDNDVGVLESDVEESQIKRTTTNSWVANSAATRFQALRNFSRNLSRKLDKNADAEAEAALSSEDEDPTMEGPPWKELRSSQPVTGQIDKLLNSSLKSSKASVRKEAQQQLRSLRDIVASEAWSLAEENMAKERRRVELQLEMGKKSQSQGREMQAACMRELNETHCRMRTLPEGTESMLDIHLCEPLQHVDEGAREVVQLIVKDRLEDIVFNFSRGADTELNRAIRQHAEKEMEKARKQGDDEIKQRMTELQGRAGDLVKQASTLRESLDAERAERRKAEMELARLQEELRRVQAELEEERGMHHSLSSEIEDAPRKELAEALVEAERQRAAAAEAQAEAEHWRQAAGAAAHSPGSAVTCFCAGYAWEVEDRDQALPNRRRPVLPGATAVTLWEHANKLHDTLGKDGKEAGLAAHDLVPTLQQLAHQLNSEVREDALAARRGEGLGFDLLGLRVSLAGRETEPLWESWLTLLGTAEEAAEAFKAPGNHAKKLHALSQKATDAIATARDSLSQCFSVFSESCSRLEGPRQEANTTHGGGKAGCLTGSDQSCVADSTPKSWNHGPAKYASEGGMPLELPLPSPLASSAAPPPDFEPVMPMFPTHIAAKHDPDGDADVGVKSAPLKPAVGNKAKRHSTPSTPTSASTVRTGGGGLLGLSGDTIMRARAGGGRVSQTARK